jgi:F-type H+-transporting ATPase subunit gamma
LPIRISDEEKSSSAEDAMSEFLIEPSTNNVLQSLLPHYVEIQVRGGIIEALASEHSARMLAMKNATENANQLTDDLTLTYNKLRQERITYEIADIVTARVSVE